MLNLVFLPKVETKNCVESGFLESCICVEYGNLTINCVESGIVVI